MMRRLAAECGWTLRQLTETYMQSIGGEVDELADAIRNRSASEVGRLAHGCKGASTTSGVIGLVELFDGIEEAGREGRFDRAERMVKQVRERLDRIGSLLEREF